MATSSSIDSSFRLLFCNHTINSSYIVCGIQSLTEQIKQRKSEVITHLKSRVCVYPFNLWMPNVNYS